MHAPPLPASRTDEPRRLGVVARAEELAAIDRLLERAGSGPVALVLEGEPGIGKTTVWREVLERAAGRSFTVLSCRPVEAEAKLAFASLADLIEPVADGVLPRLPEPQRVALEVALLRARPHGTPPSARAVASAVLSTLQLIAAAQPVVLAIDDQQWLDRPSAEAIAFALRRVAALRVAVVVATRVGDGPVTDPLALEQSLAGSIERRRLAPLSLSALHHVLRAQLGHVFQRPTLRRIAETSGGNPLFAVELARSLLDSDGPPRPGEPLPVTSSLHALFVRRLERLPRRVREVLLVASASSAPTMPLIARAVGERHAEEALARAEQARVVELRAGRVRFAHPLLASAVQASAPPSVRRRVHRRLAALVAEQEQRARHLALAAVRPDEAVARALDDAATLARRRGAPDAAAELQEQAARLTPARHDVVRRRRRLRAAEHAFHAGDRARARALSSEVLTEPASGPERATALRLLGRICGQEDRFEEAMRHLEDALACCEEPRSRVAIRLDLAYATYSTGELRRAIAQGRDTVAEAERLGDRGLLAGALAMLALGELMAGLRSDRARVARALALEDRERESQVLLRPTSVAGLVAVYEGRLDEAEALLRTMCDWARERGEEIGIPFLLFNLSRCRWLRGDLATAVTYADEAQLLAAQIGSDRMRALALVHRSRAHAMRGDVVAARCDLGDARALIEKTAYLQGVPWLLASEGLLELALGNHHVAERAFAPLVALVEANGIDDPMRAYYLPDALEVLVSQGELERAEPLLEAFGRSAEERDRPWAMACAARCRGLLAAARGDIDRAVAEAEDAVARSEAFGVPLDLGRALLVLGCVRRRHGDRRLAREALERSLAVFAEAAPVWVARVQEELRRIPTRRRAGDLLTDTEQKVGALAAAGRTNQQVARALFMSPKTVEANLSRVYAKLGIRSRAELGARMGAHARSLDRPEK